MPSFNNSLIVEQFQGNYLKFSGSDIITPSFLEHFPIFWYIIFYVHGRWRWYLIEWQVEENEQPRPQGLSLKKWVSPRTPQNPGCNKLEPCEKLKLCITSQRAILGDLLYLLTINEKFYKISFLSQILAMVRRYWKSPLSRLFWYFISFLAKWAAVHSLVLFTLTLSHIIAIRVGL